MSRVRWAHAIILVLLAVYTGLLILQVGGEQGQFLLVNVPVPLAALLAAIMVLVTWRSYDSTEPARTVWLALVLGMFLWMMGDNFYAYYALTGGEEPTPPSAGDLFWLAGYVPLVFACWKQYHLPGVPLGLRQWLVAWAIFLLLLAASTYLVLIPMLSQIEYERAVEQFVDVAYPIGDLVLVFAALPLVMLFREGLLGRAWRYILISLLVWAFTDTLYSYLSWNQLYYEPGWIVQSYITDIVYIAAYLLFFLGAFVQREILIHPPE
jgi:hypothetical protein